MTDFMATLDRDFRDATGIRERRHYKIVEAFRRIGLRPFEATVIQETVDGRGAP